MYKRQDLDSLTLNQATALGITISINQAADIDAHYSATSLMFNGWYEFETNSKWKPYIGGGLGISEINLDVDKIQETSISYDERDSVFSFQLGTGIDYEISENILIGISYRFYSNEGAELSDGTDDVDIDYNSHNILAGIKIRF